MNRLAFETWLRTQHPDWLPDPLHCRRSTDRAPRGSTFSNTFLQQLWEAWCGGFEYGIGPPAKPRSAQQVHDLLAQQDRARVDHEWDKESLLPPKGPKL
jgi:hypothetical protein